MLQFVKNMSFPDSFLWRFKLRCMKIEIKQIKSEWGKQISLRSYKQVLEVLLW